MHILCHLSKLWCIEVGNVQNESPFKVGAWYLALSKSTKSYYELTLGILEKIQKLCLHSNWTISKILKIKFICHRSFVFYAPVVSDKKYVNIPFRSPQSKINRSSHYCKIYCFHLESGTFVIFFHSANLALTFLLPHFFFNFNSFIVGCILNH